MELIVSLAMKFWQWTVLIAVVIIGAIINFTDKRKKPNIKFYFKGFPELQPIQIKTKGKGFWKGIALWLLSTRNWELKKDSLKPDFKKHTRGYLLHQTEPIKAMTEEEAIEYLILKDIPQHVWKNWDKSNRPKMVICRKNQLPATREWRNAWRISEELAA